MEVSETTPQSKEESPKLSGSLEAKSSIRGNAGSPKTSSDSVSPPCPSLVGSRKCGIRIVIADFRRPGPWSLSPIWLGVSKEHSCGPHRDM